MTMPANEVVATISRLIRAERVAQQLTIREHAELLGISMPTYFRIQRGQIDKTAQALVRIAMTQTGDQAAS